MNKSEILFYYEVKNCNPNGDPLEADTPRKDGDYILVSDVRLKRTIRDYWNLKNKENSKTYFLPKENDDKSLYTRDDLFEEVRIKVRESSEFKILDEELKEKMKTENDDNKKKKLKKEFEQKLYDKVILSIFENFIDMRLFGAVFALEKNEEKIKGNYNFTGAVQFAIGKSKHKAETKQLKGTTVAPSGEGKTQGTFTNRFVVPYALIEFYGAVNLNNYPENLKDSSTLFQNDINYLSEGMWEGTKNLLTRSKIGHRPALIIQVNYKDDKFIGFIGDYVKLETNEKEGVKISEKDIRGNDDYTLNLDMLAEKIKEANKKGIIESVEVHSSEYFLQQLDKLKERLKKDNIKMVDLSWDNKNGQQD